ncbi:MAG: hypothetical protein ACR2HJ_01475 [Fimbriimonadales bacterium]
MIPRRAMIMGYLKVDDETLPGFDAARGSGTRLRGVHAQLPPMSENPPCRLALSLSLITLVLPRHNKKDPALANGVFYS